ncbi:hypothetical protein [Embleya sp. NPDC001921]
MTEPTPDVHRRRLDAIASNAVGPTLGERWWLPFNVRDEVGRAVVQALVDAGAIPPPPPDLDAPRHTASDINDHQLAALYGELDGVYADLADARRHNDETCEAVAHRDQAEKLLHEVVDLAELTHKYGAMGGHDSTGANLTCAGCALHARIRHLLAAPYPTAADTETTAPLTDHRPTGEQA